MIGYCLFSDIDYDLFVKYTIYGHGGARKLLMKIRGEWYLFWEKDLI